MSNLKNNPAIGEKREAEQPANVRKILSQQKFPETVGDLMAIVDAAYVAGWHVGFDQGVEAARPVNAVRGDGAGIMGQCGKLSPTTDKLPNRDKRYDLPPLSH